MSPWIFIAVPLYGVFCCVVGICVERRSWHKYLNSRGII